MEIDKFCKTIAEGKDFHAEDICIDQAVEGYVSYVMIGAEVLHKSLFKKTIKDSLINLHELIYIDINHE